MLSRRARPQLKRGRVELKRASKGDKTSLVKGNNIELNWLNANTNPINLAMVVDVIIVNGRVNTKSSKPNDRLRSSGCFVKKAFVDNNNLDTRKIRE